MSKKIRCAQCLAEITASKSKCSSCNFDNSKIKSIRSAVPPGTLLDGRYYVGNTLGQGGFGITYRGFDEDLSRLVAIKEHYPKHIVDRANNGLDVIPSNNAEFKAGLNKFTDEARALARFQGHPNIVSVLSYFQSYKTAFMVMEYIEGRTVREILKGGKTFPAEDAIETIIPVLEGLKACHDTNLIHRDLTPDNIYITSSGQVKILDFGSARETVEGGENEFTQLLKQSYAPVEQFQKEGSQGPWTDIYSVGATFYRILVGKPPEFNSVERLLKDNLKRPSELAKKVKVNSEVEDVLMKALAVRPENRYQEVDSFLADLLNASMVTSPQPAQRKPRQTVRSIQPSRLPKAEKSRNFLGLAIAGVASLVVGLSAVFYFDFSGDNSPQITGSPGTGGPIITPPVVPPTTPKPPQPQLPEKKLEPDIKIEPKPVTPLGPIKYRVVVRTTPDNATIRILEPSEKYSSGMRLAGGKYTAEAWKSGYRLKRQIFTLDKDNKTVRISLDRLIAPKIPVINDFYNLTKASSIESIEAFKKKHPDFSPLSNVGNILLNNKATVSKLEDLAKQGDAESNFILGVAYAEGLGRRQDIGKAKRYLRLADAQDYSPATAWLAKTYSCSFTDIDCDSVESTQLFSEIKRKFLFANYLRAELFLKEKNIEEARYYLNIASNNGVDHAYHLLAEIEYNNKNSSRSEELWELSAKTGNTESMMRLALLNRDKSSTKTEKWLQKAYDQGDPEAGVLLAVTVGKKKPKTFFRLANEASNNGLDDGHFLKGWAHLNGIGTVKDVAYAKESFAQCKTQPNCAVMYYKVIYSGNRSKNVASLEKELLKLNNEKSIEKMDSQVVGKMFHELGKIYMIPNYKNNPSKAFNYFSASVNSYQDLPSMNYLCNMYAYGTGVKKDQLKAAQMCKAALKAGSKDPLVLTLLAEYYEKGLGGIKTNIKSATQLYEKACDLHDGLGCCELARIFKNSDKNLQMANSIRARELNFSNCRF